MPGGSLYAAVHAARQAAGEAKANNSNGLHIEFDNSGIPDNAVAPKPNYGDDDKQGIYNAIKPTPLKYRHRHELKTA